MDRTIAASPFGTHAFSRLSRFSFFTAAFALGAVFAAPWPASAAQGTGFAQWPDECHAEATIESALKADVKIPPMLDDRLEKLQNIAKYDVVCVGKTITIATPIFSNGGDVVIFADNVRISAPIRTEIGLPYSFEKHFLEPYSGLPLSSPRSVGYKIVLSVIRNSRLPATRSLEQDYRDYYRCNDSVTLATGFYCFDRPTGFTHPFFDWALSPAHIEMGYRQHDGVGVPDGYIDESIYHSGSIYIFAGALAVDDGVLVSTAGNDGSVGGLGQPPGCIGPHSEGDLSCLGFGPGAQSAPGGAGGNAGDIFLFGMAGNVLQPGTMDSSGGKPGPSTIRRSPSGEAYQFSGRLDIDFPVQSQESTVAISGMQGVLNSSVVGPDDAIDLLVSIAHARDVLVQYDLAELAQRAESDGSVTATGWIDYISQMDADLIRGEQIAVVDSALATLLAASNEPISAPPSLICPKEPLSAGHTTRVRNLVARAAPYCGHSQNKFLAFLEKTGGLLRIRDSEPGRTVVLEGIRLMLSDNSVSLSGIRGDLASVNEQLLNIYTTAERASVEAEIGRLEGRIKEFDAAISTFRDQPSALETVVVVATEAGALGLAAREFGQALDSSLTSSKKFRELGRTFALAIGKTRATLNAAMSRPQSNESMADLEARRAMLEDQVTSLREGIDAFLAAQVIRIEKVRGLKIERLRVALGARARREAIGAEVNRHFENVLKHSVLAYLLDRSLGKEELRGNLLTLRAMSANPMDQSFSFAFPGLLPPCEASKPAADTCLLLHHDAPIVVFASPADDSRVRIPAYVIRVGKTGDKLSTFGLRDLVQDTSARITAPFDLGSPVPHE